MVNLDEPRFHGGQTARQVVAHLPWSQETFDKNIEELRENLDHATENSDLPEMLSICRDIYDLQLLKAAA